MNTTQSTFSRREIMRRHFAITTGASPTHHLPYTDSMRAGEPDPDWRRYVWKYPEPITPDPMPEDLDLVVGDFRPKKMATE